MDFGALSPEINSARMYSGPGSGPMLAAASAWDGLADNLYAAAASYSSVISGLTGGPWLGPGSASMAAAAAPYVAWMRTTATHAGQAATQARAAASAYEAAFAMTVPPPLIAANRSLLMSLVATNFLGQNTPAIAATEAHYGEMWAQDAAAMYGYAGSSAAASTLTPFTPPQQTTNPTGLAGQAAAVAQAAGTDAGMNTQAMLSQLTSAVPQALQHLTSPTSSSSMSGVPSLSTLSSFASQISSFASSMSSSMSMMSSLSSTIEGLAPTASAASSEVQALGSAVTGGLGKGMGALRSAGLAVLGSGGGGSAVSAGMGRAASIGALSVPQTWAAAAPAGAMSPGAAPLPGTSPSAAPVSGLAGMPVTPMAGMAGRGAGGAAPSSKSRTTVVPRPPATG